MAPAVLVVEDEQAVRRLPRTVLEAEGYHVHEAANGREAIEFLERQAGLIDLIVTDVVMPEMTGPKLFARLAALRQTTPFLFMSGYADSQLLSRSVNESAIRILRKPFGPEELTSRVAEVVSQEETKPLET
jgi:two-component system cell cycle sensor histidine kinase/response regulator CckA